MKKLIITTLLTSCINPALALDYKVINGKKITMNDTRTRGWLVFL